MKRRLFTFSVALMFVAITPLTVSANDRVSDEAPVSKPASDVSDVAPTDVRPTDVRPTDVRPDVRPHDVPRCADLTGYDLLKCRCALSDISSDLCRCLNAAHDGVVDIELCRCIHDGISVDLCKCRLDGVDLDLCRCLNAADDGVVDIQLCRCIHDGISVDLCKCHINGVDLDLCRCLNAADDGVVDIQLCRCIHDGISVDLCKCHINGVDLDLCRCRLYEQTHGHPHRRCVDHDRPVDFLYLRTYVATVL